jgi:hypothetical protein
MNKYNPLLPNLYNNPNVDMIAQEDPNASTIPYAPQMDLDVEADKLTQYKSLLEKLQPKSPEINIPYRMGYEEQIPDAKLVSQPLPTRMPSASAPEVEMPEAPMDARMREETTNPRDIDFSYEKLQEVLKNRDSSGLNNMLLRAGMMANQGIARMGNADVKPDEGALQALSKQADMPLENFSTKLRAYGEIELQDPKSDISKLSRDRAIAALKKTNPNIDTSSYENLSAAQLKQLGVIGDDSLKALNLELQRQRLDLQKQAEAGKGERFYDRLDLSKDMFENKQKEQKRLATTQENVLTGFDTTIAALKDLKRAKPLFNTGPIKDRFESAKKILGLEDADFAGFKARVAGNMANYIRSISGTAASDAEVERLANVAPVASDSDESFLKKLASFEDQVNNSKKSVLKSFKKLDRDVKGYESDLQELEAPKEVERLDKKTGKTAIFDADTKQFLRYK